LRLLDSNFEIIMSTERTCSLYKCFKMYDTLEKTCGLVYFYSFFKAACGLSINTGLHTDIRFHKDIGLSYRNIAYIHNKAHDSLCVHVVRLDKQWLSIL